MGKRTKKCGEMLRRYRQAKDLSVEELAGSLQVSLSYLAMVERGERKPTPVFLARVARHLRLDHGALRAIYAAYLSDYSKISIDIAKKANMEMLSRVLVDLYGG